MFLTDSAVTNDDKSIWMATPDNSTVGCQNHLEVEFYLAENEKYLSKHFYF